MRRAREAIRLRGGAERANVFTRFLLALFGIVPWRAVPVMPVEIMLLAEMVSVPSRQDLVLEPHRHRAASGADGEEAARAQCQGRRASTNCFSIRRSRSGRRRRRRSRRRRGSGSSAASTTCCARRSRCFPKRMRERAIDRAVAWVGERLNGEDGLGAIFPAMANSVMMYDALGYPEDHPQRAIARKSIEKLLVVHEDEAYCQPCVSPIWDTGLACHALLEVGGEHVAAQVKRGLDWLVPMQVLDVRGDWIARRPDLRPGGWAFQYANPHYPDVDDTAVVAMAMDRMQETPLQPGTQDRTRGLRAAIDARARMDRRHAERERRLGRVRRRQRLLLSQQYSVRRSRRAARSADRGRQRAVSVDAGATRRHAKPGRHARHRLSAPARSLPTAPGTAAGA